jgi:plastocyanin
MPKLLRQQAPRFGQSYLSQGWNFVKIPRRWQAVAVLLIATALPLPAWAGVIRGTLRVPPPTGRALSLNAYPGQANSVPGVRPVVHGLASDAVISVDHVPAATESLLAGRAARPRLAQKDQSFAPRVMAVAVGSAVDFPNLDPIYHNVFSLSPVKRFDLGKYPQGQSKTIVFNRTGLVNVYCEIHSGMEAFVLVLPHHGFAQPRANGEYALPDLPAGRYTVRCWQPDLGPITRDIDVPENGSVTLDLSY